MVKNLQEQMKRFGEGKYSAFVSLFDAVNQQLWDFFEEKTRGNQSLTEYFHTKCIDRLFFHYLKEEVLVAISEEEFFQLSRDVAAKLWEEYEQIISDNFQTTEYFPQLKLKCRAKLEEKKNHNPKFLSYYFHHFRYYFTGGIIVVGVFLFAFLFGFLTFRKSPILFANPKIITQTGDQAFGLLSGVNFVQDENFFQSGVFGGQMGNEYILGSKQLPRLSRELLVAQKMTGEKLFFSAVSRSLRLPGFNGNILKDYALNFAIFTLGNWNINLDVDGGNLSLYLATDKEVLPIQDSYATSESTVKKKIKSQILALGLDLSSYADPIITQEGQVVTAFFPRLFNGKPIYQLSWKSPIVKDVTQVGLSVEYHLPSEKLTMVYGYSFQQYLVSKYPVLSSDHLLAKAEQQGFILNQKESFGLETFSKGKVVYVDQGAYLLPAIMWEANGKKYFVSLVSE